MLPLTLSFLCSPPAGAQAAIVFIKEPSSQDALQGRGHCSVRLGTGPVHVFWLLDGAPVQDTEALHPGQQPELRGCGPAGTRGAFQCVARDEVSGEEARSATPPSTSNVRARAVSAP